jgi:hypothetical protein
MPSRALRRTSGHFFVPFTDQHSAYVDLEGNSTGCSIDCHLLDVDPSCVQRVSAHQAVACNVRTLSLYDAAAR